MGRAWQIGIKKVDLLLKNSFYIIVYRRKNIQRGKKSEHKLQNKEKKKKQNVVVGVWNLVSFWNSLYIN